MKWRKTKVRADSFGICFYGHTKFASPADTGVRTYSIGCFGDAICMHLLGLNPLPTPLSFYAQQDAPKEFLANDETVKCRVQTADLGNDKCGVLNGE